MALRLQRYTPLSRKMHEMIQFFGDQGVSKLAVAVKKSVSTLQRNFISWRRTAALWNCWI